MPDELRVLKVHLAETLIGFLGKFRGETIFSFTDDYIANSARPTLSQAFRGNTDEETREILTVPSRGLHIEYHSLLPAFFSNVLPEGALRERLTAQLQVAPTAEFDLFTAVGHDLPGAITTSPTENVPDVICRRFHPRARRVSSPIPKRPTDGFSLAGVQLKFSVLQNPNRRYTLAAEGQTGSIIAKMPHPMHPLLPENEFSAMTLARLAGVTTSEFWLDDLTKLAIPGLEGLKGQFFAVRRFDRAPSRRIHSEDFAQVLSLHPNQKYGHTNYETIAKIILASTRQPLDDLRQFARRLVVNILLGNGDAHVKNFSLIYPDGRSAELAPAYDLVSTIQYVPHVRAAALPMGGKKEAYAITLSHFRDLAEAIAYPVPHALVREVRETVAHAQEAWPRALIDLPMDSRHKAVILHRLATLPLARLSPSTKPSRRFRR